MLHLLLLDVIDADAESGARKHHGPAAPNQAAANDGHRFAGCLGVFHEDKSGGKRIAQPC